MKTKSLKRKHTLLRNEIEMLQKILKNEVYPSKDYVLGLIKQLEELKKLWYRVRR